MQYILKIKKTCRFFFIYSKLNAIYNKNQKINMIFKIL